MKPIRTSHTNQVFKLEGGTEENDLPVERYIEEDGSVLLASVWELTDEERKWIAEGGRIRLTVWGTGHPPVAFHVQSLADDFLGAEA
jgi:hypothetical protein